ncbi:helix-turn-helix transcriptional regulator [[Phormidium] sp. ETS-05]|uniref:helix-turn-helix domain-containing protein n=1 Tax=[Phormidium] sp. ETS-05 TaxID=222819 RepID=UPI0018EF2F2F|nr:helix-turn-helix domain-containing protein [[Phormidium] sp. ETS-05]
MKVITKLAELKANCGDITNEEIAEVTGIDERELTELEKGEARAIELATLAKLCAFFQCYPNDLLAIEREAVELFAPQPPSAEELSKAAEIIKKGFALAEAMPPRPAEEIWKSFETTVERIAAQIEQSESCGNGTNFDA